MNNDAIMSTPKNQSGARHGRKSNNEARTTIDGETSSEGHYMWKDKNCQVMLELVIVELRAGDYRSRMSDAAAKKRIENKYFELIDMMQTWWADRIAEYGNKGNFVSVLQKKPLPFKDLLDQIFGEHDVEQDDRYSPHMLGQHLQQTQTSLASNDDTVFDQIQEVQTIHITLNRRPPRRRSSFETQVESGFQRVIDSHQDILEQLRSRKVQKLSYGDATVVLEKIPIEQLVVFWWASNKLLKNEADVRKAFIKLESEEIKIRYLESLVGIDRYENPCPHVDLNVGMTETSSMGTETDRTDFMGLLLMQSSELKQSTKDTARLVHIHDDESDAEKHD
ncbi:unnamed protein product [Eruca vesicaria subsp. sativa]|uniref:Uncharacterized protein n=1 Tax=Eruca vesicaria subsp. sativa TaxID=29727 RepID=A0ABC8J280_ERUVS|nr:unnamed protein product [Eruca vesicaria subsp. sativa]